MCGFPKTHIGGKKLWGNFQKFGEGLCEFPKAILAGGNDEIIFQEIWRMFAWMDFQKGNIGGGDETMGESL